MKIRLIFVTAALALVGVACTSADAGVDDAVSQETFDSEIQPHLERGCRTWWSLMTILDGAPDDYQSAGRAVEMTNTVKDSFISLAAADARSQYLAEAAIVFDSSTYHTPDENRAAYETLDDFCAGFQR